MRSSKLFLAGLVLLAAGPLLAQSLIGSITGIVKDEQGAVLPGVTLTLTGKTGSRTAVTDSAGSYRFPAVDPGVYSLTADLSGFQGKKQESVTISIGRQLNLDFSLKVAARAEEITVTGEAPVVDVTSTESTNTISQDLLFNMPLVRFAPDLLNYAPGINEGSAFGGGSDTANSLLIDGVDTRDPEGGTAWSFFNYNVVDEVQIQGLGAPAEYGSYTGAIVNTITKSGGNKYSGLFDVNYTKDSLSSDNNQELLPQNPTLEPSKTTSFLDWTAQMGGSIIKDKLFFFASTQRYHLKLDPDGPRTIRDELSHRGNLKLTYQPSPKDNFIGHVEYDDYSIRGRPGFDSTIDTNAQTVNEDAPEWVWNVQWRHLFGANTFLEAKYLGWWGYYYLDPQTKGSRFYDGTTNSYSDQPAGTPFAGLPSSAGEFYYADRGRHELHAAISHYADAFGKHDLKFGVQIERSRVRSRYGYPTGLNYYDLTSSYPVGQYYAYSYGYDFQARNHRESFYAQDSWKPTSRLTISPGVRLDLIRGYHPTAGKLYDTKSWAPRIGFAWDVTGDHKSVLKAHYGQYYEGAFATFYERALPGGRQDYVAYCFDGATQEPGGPPGFYECDRVPFSVPYKVDPNIKQPRVDEFTAGFERALGKGFRLAVTGIYRENKNFVDSVFPDARWEPITLTVPDYRLQPTDPPSALAGQPLNVYSWVNRTDSQSNGLITNVDGFQYKDPSGNVIGTARAFRKYRGLMFVLSKRFTDRWQAQVSYVLSKSEGTSDNSSFSANAGISHQWETPNLALVNADGPLGEDRRNEVKIFASYQVPKIDVGINAYFRHLDGIPYTPLVRFSSDNRAALGLTIVPSAYRTILAEPRGSRRLPNQNILDLRLDKIFKIRSGTDRISVYVDIANVFNTNTINEVRTRLDPTTLGSAATVVPPGHDPCPCDVPFEGPLSIVPPRQLTLGARWSF
jgi:hypothetical protein